MAQVFWKLFWGWLSVPGPGCISAVISLSNGSRVFRNPELERVMMELFVLIMTVAAGFMVILRQNELGNK
ncbi:hypothetical protein [Bradyrhizobium sp.]